MADRVPLEKNAVLLSEDVDTSQTCRHCGVHPVVRTFGPYRVRRSLWRWIRRLPPLVVEGTFAVELCDEWEPV